MRIRYISARLMVPLFSVGSHRFVCVTEGLILIHSATVSREGSGGCP